MVSIEIIVAGLVLSFFVSLRIYNEEFIFILYETSRWVSIETIVVGLVLSFFVSL